MALPEKYDSYQIDVKVKWAVFTERDCTKT